MKRKTMVLPAVAGLLASVLTACAGSDDGGSGGGTIVVGTTDRIEATADGPAPLDPAQAYDVGSWAVMHNAFQTLMRLPRSGTDPVPDAAERCGFVDRRSEQYRCTLRAGLKFANGHELTSADVKFSLDRVRAIHHENGPVELLSSIDKVEAPSPREVVIHLSTPDATFPSKLTTPAAAIVDSETYGKKSLYKGFASAGSGPYTMEAEDSGDRVTKLVFEKNPNYQGKLNPQTDKIEMRYFDDAAEMEKALADGDIDVVNREFAPEQIEKLEAGEVDGVRVFESSGQAIRYLVFNTEAPAVKEKAVRQAIAHVVNRQALMRDVYKRTGEPLYSLIPTGTTAHINSFHNAYGDPDVEKAAQILRAAGIQGKVKLPLTYSTEKYGPETAKEFTALSKQLNASGLFTTTLKDVKWSDFRPAAARGEFVVYGMGWFPDFPDPDNYIAPFIGDNNFLKSPYRNATIEDRLIPSTRQVGQRAMATRDFQRIQDIIADDVPVLPLWQAKQYVAAREDITGTEYAVDSSAMLQLWELGRGTKD
ncbi:ABC transporter substrate-binding protein [Streptomyces sp. LX-29]|uniref:ABC transporter substrate-binding protein n=1 Tax=Streptomyces sp. LX-29 TaxID=2900152 RepID=UPI00240DE09A|nr:ABC transporter substrate-binding protein [Streptomyces sp. LX-29]WFB10417.1 ABC transporter substrate-binding protein [Streptomyces sp. LX-29]